MRSFISASSVTRATCLLLAVCVAVAVGLELTARATFDRLSKIQRRTAEEFASARSIGHEPGCERKHVLVVGNSLLLEGVQFEQLRDALASHWHARRLVVENTVYFDWYYGLKRLFAEGARPDVVVLVLSTRHWTRSDFRGDYTAYYMMNTRDVLPAAHDLGLGATATSDLLVANLSKFRGARAEIRNFVLGHLVPDLGQLMGFSRQVDPTPLVDDEVEQVVRERLQRVKALTDANNARLVLLLPPLLEVPDGATGFLRASEAIGVPALRPVPSGAFRRKLYRDGFHLNPTGASMFTARLVPDLQRQLALIDASLQQTPSHMVTSRSVSSRPGQ